MRNFVYFCKKAAQFSGTNSSYTASFVGLNDFCTSTQMLQTRLSYSPNSFSPYYFNNTRYY